MQRRAPSGFEDYWEILLRRKWWLTGGFVSVAGLVFIASLILPKTYRSETFILVEPQKVPADFVKPTVSEDVTDRLQTISQEILSRSRLQRIIEQFGLYRKQAATMSQEEVVGLMRKDITVDIVTDANTREKAVGGFRISYDGGDPSVVQQVTREIASLFIEEDLKVRELQSEGTNDFIKDQLEEARDNLQKQEVKIKQFKAEHMGSLPEQEQANLSVLAELQAVLQSNGDALGRAQQQETYLKGLLQAMPKSAAPLKSATELELEAKRDALVTALQKDKPTHPDVIRLRREIAALAVQVKKEHGQQSAASQPGSDSPDEIKSQLAAIQQEIKTRENNETEVESKIRTVQRRIEVLPLVEQQFADINRDYQTSKDHYDSLLQKKNASTMAAEMERRAEGEQFRIIDPANLPQKPYKPDLAQLNLMGVLGGLGVGVGLVLLMEQRDLSIHNKKDLGFYVGAPVLATFPVITEAAHRPFLRRLRRSA